MNGVCPHCSSRNVWKVNPHKQPREAQRFRCADCGTRWAGLRVGPVSDAPKR